MTLTGEIGLGTHQPLKDNGAIVEHAIREGCKLIDTAPNYGGGENQAIIGEILSLTRSSTDTADNVILSTKVGFIPANINPAELISAGVRPDDVTTNHCISPSYIRYQVRKNRDALRGHKIDYLFLHNPEVQLQNLNRSPALTRVLHALEACEQLCEDGHIGRYGIATWKGFFDTITLADLEKGIGGILGRDNRFVALQLPISLVRIKEVAAAWLSHNGLLSDARERQLVVFGSSPLHNGELLKMLGPPLARLLDTTLTPAQVAVNFIRSTNLVDIVLVGTNSRQHLDELLMMRDASVFDPDKMQKVIEMLS